MSAAPETQLADVGRLVVRCPDRPRIGAVLSRLMADAGANIIESQQHSSDPVGGVFTLRLEFVLTDLAGRRAELERALAGLAGGGEVRWRGGGGSGSAAGGSWRLCKSRGWRCSSPRPTTCCRSCSTGSARATCGPR